MDDTQRVIALRALLPPALLNSMDDVEDRLTTFDEKMRWAGRQVERAHVKNLTEGRPKPSGINEVSHPGGLATAGVPGEDDPSATEPGAQPLLGVLTSLLAAVAKGKGKGKGGGKGKGKGGKGAPSGGKGAGPLQIPPHHFTTGCWHCGDPSHRRQECPKSTAELEKAEGGAGGRKRRLGRRCP